MNPPIDPAALDMPETLSSEDVASAKPTPAGFDPTAGTIDTGPADNHSRPRIIPKIPGYEIHSVLGQGGMGVVYRATQLGIDRPAAIKMLLAAGHATSTQLERFQSEARVAAAVKHPNIVQIYEIGEHEGLPYISLEFCEGGSLNDKLNREPQPPKKAAELAESLARAMHAAHAAGVVHRDIKPANILLDANGSPKITDFGLARELDDPSCHTRTGAIVGTPSYMAPEQAAGSAKLAGPQADQYSLAATLYDLLTGRPPFKGTSLMETLEQVRTREPVPPAQLQPGCPKDLETICLKAMSKDPEKRYSSCQAFADDLRAFLDGRPIAARPVGTIEKTWRWAKRNPRVAIPSGIAALFVVATAVLGVAFAIVFDRQKKEAEGLANDRQRALVQAEEKRVEAEKERDQKEKARQGEAENYQLARDAIIGVVDEVPNKLRQAIYSRQAQQQVLAALGDMLAKQLNLTSTRGLPDRAMLSIHMKMGDLRSEQGRLAEALKQYEDALAITTRLLAAEEREKDKAKGNHALVLQKIGVLTRDQNRDGTAAIEYFRKAEAIQREVVNSPVSGEIPVAETKQSLAGTLYDIAETFRRMQQPGIALPTCEEALDLRKEVARMPATPYTGNATRNVADSQLQEARIHEKLGDDRRAESAYNWAAQIFQELVQKQPGDLTLRLAATRAVRDYGDFLLMRGRLAEAATFYKNDLDWTRGMLATNEVLSFQSELSDSYYRTATLALKKGDREAAADQYRRCLQMRQMVAEARPTDDRSKMRVVNAQARCGQHEAASAGMAALLKAHPKDAYYCIEGACNFAICADAVADGRENDKMSQAERDIRRRYLDRALGEMQTLVEELNYVDAVRLKTDPDLDALRGEQKFAELVKVVEARRPK